MNILWIEDFGGGLDRGKATLNLMFQDLISFDNWDEDELSLLSKPSDLEKFFKDNSALHCVFLCRHYFDYFEFKANNKLAKSIDVVIIDIRLDNNTDFDQPIPNGSNDPQEKAKFHINAGFYIFNDLVHLGIPADKMCFMTGEMNSFAGFSEKCADIYIPKVIGFEKSPAEYEKLRKWIKEQESDYTILRRGIINGCQYLLNLPEDKLRFEDFIKEPEKQTSIEDLRDYLDVLVNFLPLREPEATASLYKLFIRTLAHEWEAAEPNALDKQNKQSELYAFAWIMKMTRNWLAHSKIFEQLNAQDVAYLFIVNMRAMFDLGDQLLAYENHLLSLFSTPIAADEMKVKAGENPKKRNDRNPTGRDLPLVENYAALLKKTGNTWQAINFHDALNNLQKNKDKENDNSFLIKGLYQTFWFLTSSGGVFIPPNEEQVKDFAVLNYQFKHFDYQKSEYLFELARHIYNRSFS